MPSRPVQAAVEAWRWQAAGPPFPWPEVPRRPGPARLPTAQQALLRWALSQAQLPSSTVRG
jgi:hypothetical protein